MQKIEELESLRGLMVLWVLLGHVLLSMGYRQGSLIFPLDLLARNGLAVDVVMILSGFVIFHLLDRSDAGYWPYILRRFMRLFPVYLICIIVAIGMLDFSIEALRQFPWQGARNLERLAILEGSGENFWLHLGAHLFMVHGIVPPHSLKYSDYAFVGQAWSISLEWQFYVIAPACMYALKRCKPKGV